VLGVYLILLTSIGVNIKTFQKSNNQLIFGYFKPLYQRLISFYGNFFDKEPMGFLHGYSSFSKELKIAGMNLQNHPNIRVLTSGIRVPGNWQKRPIQKI
jgi:hypothetical protein